jgi:hypothetical protein
MEGLPPRPQSVGLNSFYLAHSICDNCKTPMLLRGMKVRLVKKQEK